MDSSRTRCNPQLRRMPACTLIAMSACVTRPRSSRFASPSGAVTSGLCLVSAGRWAFRATLRAILAGVHIVVCPAERWVLWLASEPAERSDTLSNITSSTTVACGGTPKHSQSGSAKSNANCVGKSIELQAVDENWQTCWGCNLVPAVTCPPLQLDEIKCQAETRRNLPSVQLDEIKFSEVNRYM